MGGRVNSIPICSELVCSAAEPGQATTAIRLVGPARTNMGDAGPWLLRGVQRSQLSVWCLFFALKLVEGSGVGQRR
jgi:hypothetical protein